MKLHEPLPSGVTVNGRFYRADLDFRNVLRMMETLERKDLLPDAKIYLALRCVMKRPPKHGSQVLAALIQLTAPDVKTTKERTLDFAQDADLIRAAFLQSYHIDLWTENVHWFKFISLLRCLPDGSRLSNIVSIRTRPIPPPSKYNEKEREWLIRAKSEYGIKTTEEERQERFEASLHDVALGLLAFAKKGGGTDAE